MLTLQLFVHSLDACVCAGDARVPPLPASVSQPLLCSLFVHTLTVHCSLFTVRSLTVYFVTSFVFCVVLLFFHHFCDFWGLWDFGMSRILGHVLSSAGVVLRCCVTFHGHARRRVVVYSMRCSRMHGVN